MKDPYLQFASANLQHAHANEQFREAKVRDEQKESWEPDWRTETKKFEG